MTVRYDPQRHCRRSIRLRGHDYAAKGAYFVTVCTRERAPLFGEVADGAMVLNDAGRIVEKCWHDIPDHFPHVEWDAFVMMPNHIHGILWIVEFAGMDAATVGAHSVGAKNFSPLRFHLPSPQTSQPWPGTSKTIGSVIRGFKIGVTKWMRAHTDVHNVWQRNYREHIIRDDESLNRIRQYIADNPAHWANDVENPQAVGAKNFSPLQPDTERTIR